MVLFTSDEITFATPLDRLRAVSNDSVSRGASLDFMENLSTTTSIVFFFFALYLLFPGQSGIQFLKPGQDPFIVPIAIPLIAGPSSLAVVMLYSHDKALGLSGGLLAIFLAWLATAIIVVASTHIVKLIGHVGARVAERIMGLICALVGVKMILAGILLFLNQV